MIIENANMKFLDCEKYNEGKVQKCYFRQLCSRYFNEPYLPCMRVVPESRGDCIGRVLLRVYKCVSMTMDITQ